MAWTLAVSGSNCSITFGAPVSGFDAVAGRYFDQIELQGEICGFQENTIPGVDGANIGHLGFRERTIRVQVIYVGLSREACVLQFGDDTESMLKKPLDVAAGGTTFHDCYFIGHGTTSLDTPTLTEYGTAIWLARMEFVQKR